MPCPPSLEEREQLRLDYSMPALRTALEGHVRRLAVMRRAAAILEAKAPLDDQHGELSKARELVAQFDPSGAMPVWTGKGPEFKNTWPDEEDLSRQQAEESWLRNLVTDSELTACIYGCAIARWLAVRDSHDVEVKQALEFHREHRTAERAARLKELEDRKHWNPSALELSSLEKRIAALQALSDQVLFTDRRSIFG